jgi:hypothetical protein
VSDLPSTEGGVPEYTPARDVIARIWPKRHGDPALRASLRRLIRLTRDAESVERMKRELVAFPYGQVSA